MYFSSSAYLMLIILIPLSLKCRFSRTLCMWCLLPGDMWVILRVCISYSWLVKSILHLLFHFFFTTGHALSPLWTVFSLESVYPARHSLFTLVTTSLHPCPLFLFRKVDGRHLFVFHKSLKSYFLTSFSRLSYSPNAFHVSEYSSIKSV